ncbi:hypothetical protein GRI34_12975 [Erythrobacter aquimaris]|uniref:Uncharacterized protein n=1 Tax=Qipengyuania aquimaris TaxID=255984 RepID=A0A6I4TPU8_9SPHN|nr:hypothetical protein [Qipengyuania aquimaris]MXO97329.1 hypothetical protein [Qipengyuania aquimaris]
MQKNWLLLALSVALFAPSATAKAASTAGRFDTSMGRSGSEEPPHAALVYLCAAPETGNAAVIASLGDPGDGGGTANLELTEYDFFQPYRPDIRRTQIELGENDGGAGTRRYPVLRLLSRTPREAESIGLVSILDKGNLDNPELEDFDLVAQVVGPDKAEHACDITLQQRALAISGYGITTVSQATLLGGAVTDDTNIYLRKWEEGGAVGAVMSMQVQAIAETEVADRSARIAFLAVGDDGAVVSMVVSRTRADTVGWTYLSRTQSGASLDIHRHLADQVSDRPAGDYRSTVTVGMDLPEMLWRLERCSHWTADQASAEAADLRQHAFSPLASSCENLAADFERVRARYSEHDFAARALGVWDFDRDRPVSRLWTR